MSWPTLLPRRALRLALGLALVALVFAGEAGLFGKRSLGLLDLTLYDLRLRLQPERPYGKIVIVDIDERSLAEVGPWPWAPDKLATLIERLGGDHGARILGLDLILPEASAGASARLRRVLATQPAVVGFRFSNEFGLQPSGQLPQPLWTAFSNPELTQGLHRWRNFSANTPSLANAAKGSGFFSLLPDRDGVVRSSPLLSQYKDGIYPSLAVAVIQADTAARAPRMVADRRHHGALLIGESAGGVYLPFAEDGRVFFPTQGEGGAAASRFRHVSAADILAGRIDLRLIQDRIVLIGSSASTLSDLRPTATGQRFTDVELQASIIAAAFEGTLRTAAPSGSFGSAIVIGLVGLGIAVGMSSMAAPGVIGLMLLGVSLLLGWNAIAYTHLQWVAPLGHGLTLLLLLALINLAGSYLSEGRARQAVIRLFGQYVAPQLVVRMTEDPLHSPIQSQDKELTILFADIRGFTRMAERMDPQQLREVLNRFLTTMTEVIHAHHGTLDKYIGDAVMAFWGAPLDDPQHADHAVTAALAMQKAVHTLNQDFASVGLPQLSIGIGINTGMVRVGDMGSQLRRSYTVIGDAVNLAARLESISKQHGLPMAVGDATRRQVSALTLEWVGEHRVAGRDEPVQVWKPLQSSSDLGASPAGREAHGAQRMTEGARPATGPGSLSTGQGPRVPGQDSLAPGQGPLAPDQDSPLPGVMPPASPTDRPAARQAVAREPHRRTGTMT